MKTIIQFTFLFTPLASLAIYPGDFDDLEYKGASKTAFDGNTNYFFTKYLSQSC